MQYTVISDQYVSLYTHSVGLVLIVPLCGRALPSVGELRQCVASGLFCIMLIIAVCWE